MTKKPLPGERKGITHRFVIGGTKGTLILNADEEGNIVEVFIHAGKRGSSLNGLLSSTCTALNVGLRFSIPIEEYLSKFIGERFEPFGKTENTKYEELKSATSIMDYVSRYILACRNNGGIKNKGPVQKSLEILAKEQEILIKEGGSCALKGGGCGN